MEEIVLQAQPRDVIGKQVRALRRAGRLPAVIYGRHVGSIPISLDMHQATYILPTVSSSHLIKVAVENGEVHTVLVREKQRHPVNSALVHIDFLAVSLTEKLRAMVRIDLIGVSPAMKELNGVLVSGQEVIEVESLPGNLPEKIQIDISGLKEFGDAIHVRDLVIPEGVQVLTPLDELVVLITAPAVATPEEIEAAAEAVAAAGEPEVIEKGKREEEI
jgi:large subunit ribosomal protein L25